jgi:hypothetical protein
MRIDLLGVPAQSQWQPMLDALAASAVTSVAVVIFDESTSGDPRREPRLRGWANAAEAALDSGGYAVVDVLFADRARWWSLLCLSADCCPAAGTARQRGYSAAAAQATVAGLVALPDRQTLAATLAGEPEAVRLGLGGQLRAAERRLHRANAAGTLDRALSADLALMRRTLRATAVGPLACRQLARLGLALRTIAVRDEIWLGVDDGSLPAAGRLLELARRLPAPLDVAPLVLYGWHEWRQGNGTLAVMCAERALERDPAYTAASLLISTVQSGMNPRTTPPLGSVAPLRASV